jgi:hypothetical protein
MCPRQTPKITPPLKRLQATRGGVIEARVPDSLEEKGNRQPMADIKVSTTKETPERI